MANDKGSLTLKVCGKTKRTRRIRHGLFCGLKGVRIDGRTRPGRWLAHLVTQLTDHCGGPDQLSITQAIVIDGLAQKVLRRHWYNTKFFKDKDPGSSAHILALENSIRLDCQSLGLPKKAAKVLDLQTYLREKYPEAKEGKSDGCE